MYRLLAFILMFSPAVWASSVNVNQGKTYIEALSLEEQTIQLHGSVYVFAKNVVILNAQGNSIGLRGLEEGQWVSFKSTSQHKGNSYREDETGAGVITHIQVMGHKNPSVRQE